MAVYQKRSDHGVHLPHGIVQHPAGAGLGLPQTDKGNVNKLTALRTVGASGRKLPDGFDGGRKVNGAYPCRYAPFFNPTCGHNPLALPLGELSPKVTDTEIQLKYFLKILGPI